MSFRFPCPKCGDPEGQINRVIDWLESKNATIGMLWLDIEGPSYWMMSQIENQVFFKKMVNATLNRVKIGVYTSLSQWNPIMGDFTYGSLFPLWYAHCMG